MRRGLHRVTAAIATLVALATLGMGGAVMAKRVELDRVRIAVNDQVVTQLEVVEIKQMRAAQLNQQFKGEELTRQLADLDRSLLQTLIEDLLIASHAQRTNIEVTDKEINERVEAIMLRDPKLGQTYPEEQIKSFVLKDMLRQRVLQKEVEAYLAINEADVIKACQAQGADNREVDVGHILLRGENLANLEKLGKMRQALLDGADFEQMALEQSEDPSAKRNKGRLGFVTRGQFVREFEDVAFAMKVGDLSQPVKTQFGFHLIKLFGERTKSGVDCQAMDEVTRNAITNQLYGKRREERMKTFLKGLGDKADIQVFD